MAMAEITNYYSLPEGKFLLSESFEITSESSLFHFFDVPKRASRKHVDFSHNPTAVHGGTVLRWAMELGTIC